MRENTKTLKHKNTKTQKHTNNLFSCFRVLVFSCFLVSLAAADRLTKTFFINNPDHTRDFLFLKFNLTLNSNIAFSLPVPQVVIIILVIIILFFLFYLLVKNIRLLAGRFKPLLEPVEARASTYPFAMVLILSLIIIGAISNLIDRLQFGGVIDFIDVPYFTIFNLADVYIVFGVGLWLLLEKNNGES